MILRSKLRIPQGSNAWIARPRLKGQLDDGMDVKLTLISAQAGYGKTTLLSKWALQSDKDVAWVSLDRQDNDWTQYWHYVIAAIGEALPGFGEKSLALFDKGSGAAIEAAVAGFLNELDAVTGELAVIIDDYHVIEASSIHQSMADVLERLPANIHIYIASRSELAFPTARLRAKGEYRHIQMTDLRFQFDEGLAFFRDTTELSLTREQVAELFRQTEGWVSGLQLAAMSLRESGNISETIRQFGGRQHHISDYLLEEVFRRQAEPVREFLLATSILSRMNRSLCDAVTGGQDGQEMLERLEQLNLFIVSLDDRREGYRYHQLLSEFLQRQLSLSHPERWDEVHVRAARWLELHGFDEEAVEHYVEGKQARDAVRLIEKNLRALVQFKSTVLIRWVSALPEDSFAEKPMLELFYISVLLGVGKWQEAFARAERAEIHFQALRDRMSEADWNQAMGNMYFFRAITAYLQKDLERMSACFDRVEQHVPEGSVFQTMGRNRFQGYELFDDHFSFINDLHRGADFLLRWIGIWEHKPNYPFMGYLSASYSKLLYEWNRLDEAEHYASQVLERQDMAPFARILIHIAISASRIGQAQGNSERASAVLEQLKAKIDSPDYDLFLLRIEAEQAGLSLRQGLIPAAEDWMRRSGLSSTDELSLNRMAEHLVLARVLVATGRLEEALPLLERMERMLESEDSLRDRIQALILLSLALWRLDREQASLQRLETALRLAEPHGYIRSFIDEGPTMAELLNACLRKAKWDGAAGEGQSSSLPYMKHLLRALAGTPEEEAQQPERLTGKEMSVLRLIADGQSNKEIANNLGISDETVKSHIKNVYRKLGANNRVRVLQRAAELNLR